MSSQSLVTELQKAMDDNIAIILNADLNKSLSGSEHSNNKFKNIRFFNIIQNRIGDGFPATRIPGSQAIDHIWASQIKFYNMSKKKV